MSKIRDGRGPRRAAVLAAIIIVQGICAVFFIGDVIVDLTHGDHLDDAHMMLELVAAFGMLAGVLYLMLELRALLARMAEMDAGLRAARGEMSGLIEAFFDGWGLTPSERDVALMILKGVENDAIARMRGTAVGTVRAQTARVYAKAGVESRAQLFSVFMEELMADELHAPQPEGAQPGPA